jgi:FtsH-binding integral membrane protein
MLLNNQLRMFFFLPFDYFYHQKFSSVVTQKKINSALRIYLNFLFLFLILQLIKKMKKKKS